MKIILTQEVRSLGSPGDVVEVADGYARNFLIPRGLASRATKGALKQVDTIKRTREVREVRDREKAEELAATARRAARFAFTAKAGDGGRLFGQVTPQAVADAIVKAGGPKIDRKRLHFEAPDQESRDASSVACACNPEVEALLNIEVVKA